MAFWILYLRFKRYGKHWGADNHTILRVGADSGFRLHTCRGCCTALGVLEFYKRSCLGILLSVIHLAWHYISFPCVSHGGFYFFRDIPAGHAIVEYYGRCNIILTSCPEDGSV